MYFLGSVTRELFLFCFLSGKADKFLLGWNNQIFSRYSFRVAKVASDRVMPVFKCIYTLCDDCF